MTPRCSAFPAEVDDRARVLILGSLPGRASLARAEYYGNPRNAFWRLVGDVLGLELAALAYPARLAALREARVGLADVVASAVRPGSLDAAMREVERADLAGLVARLPELKAIAFNGGSAARIGSRQLAAFPDIARLVLPSSSPAYAAMPYSEKLRRWAVLADRL